MSGRQGDAARASPRTKEARLTSGKHRRAPLPSLDSPRTILRHRPPLLLVDEVLAVTPKRWLVASWAPDGRWPIFRGHFPDEPVVPGVLLVEAIAQASALLAYATEPFDVRRTRMYLVTIERARFLARVSPGNRLEIRTDLVDRRGPLWRFEGSIAARGRVAADARLVAALLAESPEGRRGGRQR